MSNVPATMTNCPSDETLALFVDGRLDGPARQEVVQHAAVCAECRSILVAATEFANASADGAGAVAPFRRNRRLPAVVAAVAAVVVAVWLLPIGRDWVRERTSGGLDEVMQSYQSLSRRDVEPRFSAPFAYKELKRTTRGAGDDERDVELLPLAATASKLAESDLQSWKQLRALALARLLMGERDAAADAIERARKAGGDADAAFLTDAAAVYLERARFSGANEDQALAMKAAERAWAAGRTAPNAWNRALAYEYAGHDAEAVRAWKEYLALDGGSEWAAEARDDHLRRLETVE